MEALDEAVGGTAGCVLSGALLTLAALLLLTGRATVALATMGGVVVVLGAFFAYLVARGYAFGMVEAIAITIFIGFACDYCVHVAQIHRSAAAVPPRRLSGAGALQRTLTHAGPALLSSALTTAGSALPLLLCNILVFRQMGEFIAVGPAR